MAGEPWKRIKTSAATNAPGVGASIAVAFDESTPLDASHTLVAIAQWSGASTDASNSWGATGIAQSGSNGSNNYSAAYIVPGDAVKNGITFTFSVAQAQAAVVLMAFEGFVSATPHTAGVSNQAASTTSTAGPPSVATSVSNTIAIVTTALSTGGGGTWGTWDSGFSSAPISLSRLHVGAKALTTSGQLPSSSITHSSSRAKRVMAFTIQGTAPSANNAPTVSVGADKHALVGDTVSTTATASDTDGTIATYNWSVVSCDVTAPTLSNANTATMSFVPDRPMTVTLRCTVEDNLGASASDDVVVRVSIARAPSGIQKGLIAEWNFTESAAPFFTQDGALPLAAVGSVPRVTTPWGYGIDVDGSPNYLRVPAANLGALNMGDWGGKVTVAAWVKRQDVNTGFVAGGWQEDNADPRRQYGLFIDLGAYGGSNMSCFHVSKLGGPTPGFAFSKDYSASGSTVTNDVWEFHVGTYDGAEARSYLNGNFTAYPTFTDSDGQTYAKNPYAYTDGLNATPVDFTVGAVKLTAGMGNFFDGQIAKLRVWDRAITPAEVAALYAAEVPGSIGAADPVNVSDSVAAVLSRALTATPADSVAVTDSASVLLGKLASPADSVSVTDSAAVLLGASLAPADTVAVTDSTSVLLGVSRTASDPVPAADTATYAIAFVRAPTDPVGVTDSLSALLVTSRNPADLLGVSDTVDAVFAGSGAQSASDQLGITDQVGVTRAQVLALADQVAVSDSVSALLSRVLTVSDPIGLTDGVTAWQARVRTPADPVAVTDSVSAQLLRVYTFAPADQVGVTDAVNALLAGESKLEALLDNTTLISSSRELFLTAGRLNLTLVANS